MPEKLFKVLKDRLSKGQKIDEKSADGLVNWTIKSCETLIPVDMNGAGENLDEFDSALKSLGATRTVECFVKAHNHFEDIKGTIPVAARAKPMTVKEWKIDNGEDDDEEDDLPCYKPDLFHLPKTAFEAVKAKLSKKQEISKAEVDALVNWTAPDCEILVPVDMNGGDEDLDDFDEMLEKLGPKTIAECFVQAEEHLEKKRSILPADKLRLITIKEWKGKNDDEDEDDDEQAAEDVEDADDGDGDDEEEEEEDEDADEEPATKRTKN